MPATERRQLLAGHPLFRHLSPADIDRLLAHARVAKYGVHDVIFRKDDPGHSLMAVLSGRVKITSSSPEGKEFVIRMLEPGGVFGEIALLDGKPRTADATAVGPCELLVLDRRDFLAFLESNPRACIDLMAVLCERLRLTTEQLEEVLFLELPARLARLIIRLAAAHGQRQPQGRQLIDLQLSQRELGDMVGFSRESINKQLKDWQSRGIVDVGPQGIAIVDAAALAHIAEVGEE